MFEYRIAGVLLPDRLTRRQRGRKHAEEGQNVQQLLGLSRAIDRMASSGAVSLGSLSRWP